MSSLSSYTKKKRKKLDDRFYEGIHISYEDTDQYQVYDLQSGRVFVIKDLHFNEVHYYDWKDLKPQHFDDDEWNKEDNKLFAGLIDIIDVSEPVPEINTILWNGSETYSYLNESRNSSSYSDISDSVKDKESHDDNDANPKDQLRRE